MIKIAILCLLLVCGSYADAATACGGTDADIELSVGTVD